MHKMNFHDLLLPQTQYKFLQILINQKFITWSRIIKMSLVYSRILLFHGSGILNFLHVKSEDPCLMFSLGASLTGSL